MKKMLTYLRYPLLLLGFTNCAFWLDKDKGSGSLQAQETVAGKNLITVTNTANYAIYNKPCTIFRKQLGGGIAKGLFPLITDHKGQLVPAQLIDADGNGEWDELFFLVNAQAKATLQYKVSWQRLAIQFATQARVRFGKRDSKDAPVKSAVEAVFYPNMLQKLTGFEPYQTDGPTWENDKVAFRHYFDGRNAKDLFGKRTNNMSPDSVGIAANGQVEDNYHILKDWGRDILPVANSVGLGGVGLWYQQQLHRIGVTAADSVHNVAATTLKVVASGPLQARLQMKYKNWLSAGGRTYQVQETPTIWPGMYAYQNMVRAQALQGDESWAIGLPKVATNKQPTVLKLGKWVVLYTYDAQTFNKEYLLGMAIVVPAALYQSWAKAPDNGSFSNTYFAKLKAQNDTPITYYAVGCWELANPAFKTEDGFVNYLNSFVEQLNATVRVVVK